MREEADKIRIVWQGFHCLLPAGTPDKEASRAGGAITTCDLLRFMGRDVCAVLLVAGVKTAAVLDLQKLSCPLH